MQVFRFCRTSHNVLGFFISKSSIYAEGEAVAQSYSVKNVFLKFFKIHGKTHVPESFFK